jgi:simple sugar transport system ATP-binding protein
VTASSVPAAGHRPALDIEVVGMTKRFGALTALEGVSMRVVAGSFHALLGENGAGKSTLVKCLVGYYQPDAGEILVDRRERAIRSPHDAHALGIGMVYQHFTLVPSMTVAENLVMARDDVPAVVRWRRERERLAAFMGTVPFAIDLDQPVARLAAGEKQKVEILKQLYLRRRFMILDEPTSVLTPSETEGLFKLMRAQRDAGETVVFISHKLPEALAIADRITVMRHGKNVQTLERSEADVDVVTNLMIGGAVPAISRPKSKAGKTVMEVEGLTVEDDRGEDAVRDLSLTLAAGEIVGVAGVTGNGQRELSEALAGLRIPKAGRIAIDGEELAGNTCRGFVRAGVGFVPEDRLGTGLAGSETIWRNAVMRRYGANELTHGPLLDQAASKEMARRIVEEVRLSAEDLDTPVRALSGGHAQRLLTGRELAVGSRVLILAFPTRGLDVSAAAYLRQTIIEARDSGIAVLFISEELDEIIEISDRVVVMYEGRINAEFEGEIDRAAVGRAMGGVTEAKATAKA